MEFTGKNKLFTVIWNCGKQTYTVYKNNKYLTIKFRYNDVKSYLN